MRIVSHNEDKDLLTRVATGDRNAFTQFYSSHLNSLYKYIYLFTRSKEETEEIIQDVFIKVWEHREKLTGLDSAKHYLMQIAKNKIIDQVRSLQIRQRVLSEIRRSKGAFNTATGDECAYREYYKVVQQAIDKLPPKRQLIFRMNVENGLSYDEIAKQLKISKSVVQKQSYSASHFVRKYLFEHAEIAFFLFLVFSLL